jgi:hypothetical protein
MHILPVNHPQTCALAAPAALTSTHLHALLPANDSHPCTVPANDSHPALSQLDNTDMYILILDDTTAELMPA